MSAPEPGDYFVVRTEGWAARVIRWVTESTVNHAGVYIGDGLIVEAQPHGAIVSPIAAYPHAVWSSGLADGHRAGVCSAARALVGKPYGWADIVAIGLAQRRLGGRINPRRPLADQPWWARRLMDPRTLICSQLVDVAYATAGVPLFTDGRLPGLVSPADLGLIGVKQ